MNSLNVEQQQNVHFRQTITVIAVIISLCYLATHWTNKKSVTGWTVVGAKLLTLDEITAFAGVNAKDSIRRGTVSLFGIESKVNQHTFVRNSQVSFDGLNKIKIEVVERNPIAAIVEQDGSLKYIDSAGNSLPYRLFSTVTDVPLIYGIREYGIRESSKPESQIFRIGLELIIQLQRYSNVELLPQLGSITWLNNKKCWQLDFDDYDVHILLGNMQDVQEQLDKLNTALNEIPQTPELLIDLRWNDKIVCTKPNY